MPTQDVTEFKKSGARKSGMFLSKSRNSVDFEQVRQGLKPLITTETVIDVDSSHSGFHDHRNTLNSDNATSQTSQIRGPIESAEFCWLCTMVKHPTYPTTDSSRPTNIPNWLAIRVTRRPRLADGGRCLFREAMSASMTFCVFDCLSTSGRYQEHRVASKTYPR